MRIERVNRRHYRTRAEARADIFDYIERFHNPRKRRKQELLEKMVAERDLEIDVMKEISKKVVSAAVRRRQVDFDAALIDPGKPWQNATNESFNDKFRGECLRLEWARSPSDAKVLIEIWRRQYNEVRRRSSFG